MFNGASIYIIYVYILKNFIKGNPFPMDLQKENIPPGEPDEIFKSNGTNSVPKQP